METSTTNGKLEKTLNSLENLLNKRGFNVLTLSNEEEVIQFINQNVPTGHLIGLGDSLTNCRLNIRNVLVGKGCDFFYSWNGEEDYNLTIDTFEKHPNPEYYLTRINAITHDGEMLLNDFSKIAAGKGNFPEKVYAFVGYNRIVEAFSDTGALKRSAIIKDKPEGVEFTVILLPTISY